MNDNTPYDNLQEESNPPVVYGEAIQGDQEEEEVSQNNSTINEPQPLHVSNEMNEPLRNPNEENIYSSEDIKRIDDVPVIHQTTDNAIAMEVGEIREWTCQADPSHENIRATKKCRNCKIFICLACETEYTRDGFEINEICLGCKEQFELEPNGNQQQLEQENIPTPVGTKTDDYNFISKHVSLQLQLCFLFLFFVVLSFFIFAPLLILPLVTAAMVSNSIGFCIRSKKFDEEIKWRVQNTMFWDSVFLLLQSGFYLIILLALVAMTLFFFVAVLVPVLNSLL